MATFELPDVERWIPTNWDQVIGNKALVEHLRGLLWSLRFGGARKGINTLVFGASRTGKTSTLKLFARCLLCKQLDSTTLNPCPAICDSCQNDAARFGEEGIEVQLAEGRFHYKPVDCLRIAGADDLRNRINEMWEYEGHRVIHLDEVHRLANRGLDEHLLKPSEELNYLWLASAARIDKLDPTFLNRFSVKLGTELPVIEDLAEWLARRCLEWQIAWDDAETLWRLAQRASLVPGLALQPIARANIARQRVVTRTMVEQHVFVDQNAE